MPEEPIGAAQSGQSGQPGQAGQTQNNGAADGRSSGDAKKEEPKLPENITFSRHGKKVTLPTAKVLELANNGLEIDARGRKLTERERALRSDEVAYGEYQRFRSALDANPKLARALEIATEDPDRVLDPGPRSRRARDDGELDGERDEGRGTDDREDDRSPRNGHARHNGVSAEAQALRDLQARLERLEGNDQQRSVETRRDRIERQVTAELDEHPWLKGRARSHAQELILARLAASRGSRGITDVVAEVTTDLRTAREEEDQRRLDSHDERKVLRTSPPGESIPGLTPERKYTKADLESGVLASDAAGALRKFMGRFRK